MRINWQIPFLGERKLESYEVVQQEGLDLLRYNVELMKDEIRNLKEENLRLKQENEELKERLVVVVPTSPIPAQSVHRVTTMSELRDRLEKANRK